MSRRFTGRRQRRLESRRGRQQDYQRRQYGGNFESDGEDDWSSYQLEEGKKVQQQPKKTTVKKTQKKEGDDSFQSELKNNFPTFGFVSVVKMNMPKQVPVDQHQYMDLGKRFLESSQEWLDVQRRFSLNKFQLVLNWFLDYHLLQIKSKYSSLTLDEQNRNTALRKLLGLEVVMPKVFAIYLSSLGKVLCDGVDYFARTFSVTDENYVQNDARDFTVSSRDIFNTDTGRRNLWYEAYLDPSAGDLVNCVAPYMVDPAIYAQYVGWIQMIGSYMEIERFKFRDNVDGDYALLIVGKVSENRSYTYSLEAASMMEKGLTLQITTTRCNVYLPRLLLDQNFGSDVVDIGMLAGQYVNAFRKGTLNPI